MSDFQTHPQHQQHNRHSQKSQRPPGNQQPQSQGVRQQNPPPSHQNHPVHNFAPFNPDRAPYLPPPNQDVRNKNQHLPRQDHIQEDDHQPQKPLPPLPIISASNNPDPPATSTSHLPPQQPLNRQEKHNSIESQPAALSSIHSQPHRSSATSREITHIIFPVLFFILFAVFLAVVIVYSFAQSRPAPAKFLEGMGIAFGIVLVGWAGAIFAVCVRGKIQEGRGIKKRNLRFAEEGRAGVAEDGERQPQAKRSKWEGKGRKDGEEKEKRDSVMSTKTFGAGRWYTGKGLGVIREIRERMRSKRTRNVGNVYDSGKKSYGKVGGKRVVLGEDGKPIGSPEKQYTDWMEELDAANQAEMSGALCDEEGDVQPPVINVKVDTRIEKDLGRDMSSRDEPIAPPPAVYAAHNPERIRGLPPTQDKLFHNLNGRDKKVLERPLGAEIFQQASSIDPQRAADKDDYTLRILVGDLKSSTNKSSLNCTKTVRGPRQAHPSYGPPSTDAGLAPTLDVPRFVKDLKDVIEPHRTTGRHTHGPQTSLPTLNSSKNKPSLHRTKTVCMLRPRSKTLALGSPRATAMDPHTLGGLNTFAESWRSVGEADETLPTLSMDKNSFVNKSSLNRTQTVRGRPKGDTSMDGISAAGADGLEVPESESRFSYSEDLNFTSEQTKKKEELVDEKNDDISRALASALRISNLGSSLTSLHQNPRPGRRRGTTVTWDALPEIQREIKKLKEKPRPDSATLPPPTPIPKPEYPLAEIHFPNEKMKFWNADAHPAPHQNLGLSSGAKKQDGAKESIVDLDREMERPAWSDLKLRTANKAWRAEHMLDNLPSGIYELDAVDTVSSVSHENQLHIQSVDDDSPPPPPPLYLAPSHVTLESKRGPKCLSPVARDGKRAGMKIKERGGLDGGDTSPESVATVIWDEGVGVKEVVDIGIGAGTDKEVYSERERGDEVLFWAKKWSK
ncbi:hypothetical protein EG329_007930 [Mollisiaceae sp. DMI_Dod_QoI]|nr:hypothetical protein EG329_007930 [Helotiales sp. DMI_Dod_QoI]